MKPSIGLRGTGAPPLKPDRVAALELQHGARLGGRRDLERQLLEDAADLGDLLGVALRQLAAADDRGCPRARRARCRPSSRPGRERHLVAAGGQHRPVIVVAEQPVGGPLHEHQIVRIGADAAQNAEDRLDEERRLDQPAVEEMREVVEVADIVAFDARSACRSPRRAASRMRSMSVKVLRKMKSSVARR